MRALWAGAPGAALLVGGVVIPLLLLGRMSLFEGGDPRGFGLGTSFYVPGTWSLDAWRAVVMEPGSRALFWATLRFGLITTTLTLAAALPLSWWIAGLSARRAALALGLVLLPKLANMLVIVYGLMLVLSNAGSVNAALVWLGVLDAPTRLTGNLFGAVVGECYLLLAYPVLILTAALRGLDPKLAEAARGLGASEVSYVVRIVAPLVAPSLGVASVLTFVWALGAFVGPMLLGAPQDHTVAVDVQRQAFEHLAWPRAAAEALCLFALMAALVGAARWRGRP